ILRRLKKDTVIFEGTARRAIEGFPKNINVAAVASIAGIGAVKTRVSIVACPRLRKNIHTLEIEGDFGKIECRTENVPSPDNPRTSALASLSVLAALDGMVSTSRIGT
ncbi:MAG: DUF108 domain-containing protein, partial [Candidatus Omnitrophica bacterium]|nr:DUF108 domain-containing protein [Candidatus Omnitrophota bacterium]